MCENHLECYNYKFEGPLNDTCENMYPGMKCNSTGLIFYPRQFLYWNSYLRPDDDTGHPLSQLITGLAVTWSLILYFSLKKLDTLGSIMAASFTFQFIMLIIAVIISTCFHKSTDSFVTFLKIDLKSINLKTGLNAAWLIAAQCVLVPCGYMTIYAHAYFTSNFGFECFLITLLNLLLRIFYFIAYYLAAGVIAYNLQVKIDNVVAPEGGLFYIVLPEFFDHIRLSNVFLVVYFISLWAWSTTKHVVCMRLLLLNLFDYFPRTKPFSSYVAVSVCITLALLSIGACLKKFNLYVTPFFMSVCLRIFAELWVTVMSTTVGYIYGVSRLCEDIEFTTGRKPVQYWRTLWYVLPIFGWFTLFILDKDVIPFAKNAAILNSVKHKNLYIILSYVVFLSIVVMSTIFKIIPLLNVPNLFLKLIKPQFYWGPPLKDLRMKRKLFNPTRRFRSENVYTPKVEEMVFVSMESLTSLIDKSIDEHLVD
ncbi:hypothetical protein FQR65_LT13081 [Abscondita terminalis]|nr:hypothetical protein FQR65_LT13081 [Abscondita terminalis]